MSNEQVKKTGRGKAFWATIIVMVLIPVTILISSYLGDRKFYISSVIIMVLSMIPFFVSFESRKPHARELVTLAVMCAIAVAARTVFIAVPHFKPIGGIVMITAMAFGPQAGFMTGSLSMLISDMIFGQGPWTPWQMLGFGLLGFVAGLMGKAKILSIKTPVRNAIIGFLLIMLVVGPLLDTSTVFFMASMVSGQSALAVYLAGIPINAIHASAVAACMFFLTRPIMEKLDRIKLKYGMME